MGAEVTTGQLGARHYQVLQVLSPFRTVGKVPSLSQSLPAHTGKLDPYFLGKRERYWVVPGNAPTALFMLAAHNLPGTSSREVQAHTRFMLNGK